MRRPANAFARQADTQPGVIPSLETDKLCPCLVELNPGDFIVLVVAVAVIVTGIRFVVNIQFVTCVRYISLNMRSNNNINIYKGAQ